MAKKSRFKEVAKTMFRSFFYHNVSKNAAALAYYLLFALFPILIFVSNLLGILDLNVNAIIRVLSGILPKDVVQIVESYLYYVSSNSNHVLLWFSLVFSIWFPMRAVKGLMDDVRRAYGLGRPASPVLYSVRQFLYTVVFLTVLVLTLAFSTVGERVLIFIDGLFPKGLFKSYDYLIGLWQYLRFFLIAFLMLGAIGILYLASLDKKEPVRTVLPGIFTALLSWLFLSIGFSFYVENFSNYTLIYGTLGAIVVLLIWLYMSALILILGAELNAAISKIKED